MKKAGNFVRLGVASLVATVTFACGDIVFKVSKKGKDKGDSDLKSEVDGKERLSFSNIQDFFKEIDDLSKDEKAALILEYLNGGGRTEVRNAVRGFRDSIVRNALTEHSYRNGAFAVAKDCDNLEKIDLSVYEGNKDLGIVLQAAVLATLDKASAAKINDNLAVKIDAVSEIIAKYELGIVINGATVVTEENGKKIFDSKVFLQVISEAEASEEQKEADKLVVQLNFVRITEGGSDKSFILDARVAAGLLENAPTGPLFFLNMTSENTALSNNGLTVTITAENGTIVDSKKIIAYGRQLTLMKTFDSQGREKFWLADVARPDLPAASRPSVDGRVDGTLTLDLDFNTLQKCKSNTPPPGVEDPNCGKKGCGEPPVDDCDGKKDCGPTQPPVDDCDGKKDCGPTQPPVDDCAGKDCDDWDEPSQNDDPSQSEDPNQNKNHPA